MSPIIKLPLNCMRCGHGVTTEVEGWNPLQLVQTSFICPKCLRENPLTLPGRIIETKGRVPMKESRR